ncbi:HlyD family type I secretion periplasmic adaptor subunit [Pelomonas sp. P7]|uniref:Membrane fusion protein (MFP) family protein n=1 Tax=Pelomonas caseinilytica TaxID=2906763 RepID=A0ABS8XBX5_9BURK|nr:HlyD family type I secretion periplasmic adaptor subunit [Pelomonas sp. P7]MCE4536487.1 HlyD family type I secretion periplasmic adaptor subunit [Pelomonas sp. P7]
MSKALTREEGLFVSAIHAAQIDEPLPRATWALYLLCAVVAVAVAWSALAKVDEITRSDGRIVPDGREQVIASLDAGILREMKVREGQEVQAGEELATLDPTRVEAQQAEGQAKLLALKAAAARLTAEANGRSAIQWPADVDPKGRYAQGEAESFEARRRLLDESVAAINRSLGMISKELRLAQDMASHGLMSDVEVMRLNRQVNEIQQQRAERLSRYRQEASQELVRVQSELAQLDEQMVVRQDALTRTVLKSPVHGVVKTVKAATIGGVVASGAPILEIAPIGPKVLVEARIKPKDIGFVRLGQKAEIKLAGYDFNTYGGLEGKVTYIGPDAVTEGDKSGEGHYRVVVTAERNNLKYKGEPLPVIPGMTSVVEIKTGERSVLSYLLRPMMKSQEALRER